LGFRESSIPWSYIDSSTNKVVGYSHETAMRIVNAVKLELGLPDLQVREIPITAQNRISLMQNGTIDFECNGTTNTAERRRVQPGRNESTYRRAAASSPGLGDDGRHL